MNLKWNPGIRSTEKDCVLLCKIFLQVCVPLRLSRLEFTSLSWGSFLKCKRKHFCLTWFPNTRLMVSSSATRHLKRCLHPHSQHACGNTGKSSQARLFTPSFTLLNCHLPPDLMVPVFPDCRTGARVGWAVCVCVAGNKLEFSRVSPWVYGVLCTVSRLCSARLGESMSILLSRTVQLYEFSFACVKLLRVCGVCVGDWKYFQLSPVWWNESRFKLKPWPVSIKCWNGEQRKTWAVWKVQAVQFVLGLIEPAILLVFQVHNYPCATPICLSGGIE